MSTDAPLYTRQFFQIFVAVIFFMTGVSLQFHFGDYVGFVGYDVDRLGSILSIAGLATLACRLQIGGVIDRFGCRPIWLVGSGVVAVAIFSMQFARALWLITSLRLVTNLGVAAVMTTVAVFAANIAPPLRKAESIGTIGLSGFLGMIIGPTLGDWILSDGVGSIAAYRVFFSASALFSVLAGATILFAKLPPSCGPRGGLAASDDAAHRPGLRSMWRLLTGHWPGFILVVSMAFHVVFCVPSLYLERLADARGFYNIKVFFLVYASTAITARIAFRRLPQQIGRRLTLVGGLSVMAVGLWALAGVATEWGLVLPAFLMGIGHCFIYPSMIDLAAGALPPQHRGTGTSFVLAAGDVGYLIGFAGLGQAITILGYSRAILALAVLMGACALVFAMSRRASASDAALRSG